MSFKTRDEMHLRPSFESFMYYNIGLSLKLTTFASNIKSKVFGVLDSFLSFLKTYEEKKTHNMLSLMFDPRFKSLHLVFHMLVKSKECLLWSSMIYRRVLYPMLVKLYSHLHLVGDAAFCSTDLDVDEDYALNIFQMTTNSAKIAKEIVTQKLLDLGSFMWM
jgi:hypothetical protein